MSQNRSDRLAMARGMAFLYVAGATIVLLTLLVPHAANTAEEPLAVAVTIAYCVTLLLAIGRDRLPLWTFHALCALGSVLISVCVFYGGAAASAYPVFFVLVGLYSGWFFSPRAAAAHTVFALVLYGLLALLRDGPPAVPGIHWMLVAGNTALVVTLTSRQVQRLRGHRDDLRSVIEMANGLTDPERFAQATCAGLARAAGADLVVLLEPAPDGTGLSERGRAGALDRGHAAAGGGAALLRAPATQAALERCVRTGVRETLTGDDGRVPLLGGNVRGVAEPVLRDGRPVAALVYLWRRPRRGVSGRVAVAAMLFAAQASVGMDRVERLHRDQERRALQINDTIVQGLAVAKYAIEQGLIDEAVRAVDDTLTRARVLVTAQLDAVANGGTVRPGDLVQRDPSPL